MEKHGDWSDDLGDRGCAAFSLMELLAVIAIITIVAGLTLGTLGYVNRKGAEGRAKAEVASLSAAIDSFMIDHGALPAPDELFNELTGQGTVNTGKVYLEPRAAMLDTNRQPVRFVDPWGNPYNYRTNNLRNVGFFDLWSTSGGKTEEADWIHN
jgi:prepilin-type N-terminal cleavage/methylation domain-containing protein